MAKKTKQKKIFVLDTNVVLYDFQSIYSFDDNIVVIPITLLEEIDKFKRGNEIINYNAREFARELDIIFGDSLLSDGVKLDTGEEIVVSTNTNFDEKLKNVFWEDKPDHRILSVAFNLAIEKGAGNVFLVSKDINLRMKAKSVGIHAQDYETGKIKDIDELYSGKNLVEHIQSEVIDEIYKSGYIELDKSGVETKPLPNEYFILRNGNKSILTVFHDETKTFRQVEKMRAYGITPRNAEQAFALNALMNPEVSLVT